MILRRFFTLAVLAVAVSLSFSGRANASYDTTTSVFGVSGTGVVVGTVPGTGPTGQSLTPTTPFTIATSPLPTTITPTNGWFGFVDGGGSTIYLVNQVLGPTTNPPPLVGLSVANEALFVSAGTGVNDTSTWTATLQIGVANPGGGATLGSPIVYFGSGTTAAAGVESATYVMSIASGAGGAIPTPPTPTLSGALAIIVGSNSFLLSNPSALLQQSNATTNNGGIGAAITTGAIPEPASVVILGSGLAGVLVLGLRRRSKVV
jgi:hypothetical protein